MALIDKSLLRVDESGRYSLHELLRQFGEEQLNLSPQTREQTLDLHRAYYMKLLGKCQNQIVFLGTQKEGVATIGEDLENVRPAWQRAVEQGRFEEMCAGGEGLWGFY
jgi:hypothetical protein